MMNVFALAVSPDATNLPFGERALTALIVSLQGMLTIFLVLALLWGAIEALHFALVGRKEKAAKKAAPAPEAAPAPTPAPEAASAPAPVADDGAIVAAITAAISAQLASEGYTGGFRVVSFKRANASSKKRI